MSRIAHPLHRLLALRADAHGRAHGTIAELAGLLAVSERSVQRALRELERTGALAVDRADGAPNVYRLVRSTSS